MDAFHRDSNSSNKYQSFYFYSQGTLYVVLDLDEEVLEWLGTLSSEQLSDCSWLIAFPTNNTSKIKPARTTTATKTTEPFEMNIMFSPFKSLLSKHFFISEK